MIKKGKANALIIGKICFCLVLWIVVFFAADEQRVTTFFMPNFEWENLHKKDTVSNVNHCKSTIRKITKRKIFCENYADSLSLNQASLWVPKHCIKSNQELSITELSSDDLPPFPIGMVNVTQM